VPCEILNQVQDDGLDALLAIDLLLCPLLTPMEQIRGVLRLYYNDDKSNREMSVTAKRAQVRNSIPEPPRISQKENGHEY
jgi:hypothetical protein